MDVKSHHLEGADAQPDRFGGRAFWAIAVGVLALLLEGCGGSESAGDRLVAGNWVKENLPLNVPAAADQGWFAVGNGCHPQYGRRFRSGGAGPEGEDARLSPTLMFNNEGNIHGLQLTVDTQIVGMYPESNVREELKTGDNEAGVTVYFSDPAQICSATPSTPPTGSIGDRLLVRTSDGVFETIPLSIPSMDASIPGFNMDSCKDGMGTHFWRTPKKEVPYQDYGTLFVMYDTNLKITAFGVSYTTKATNIATVGNVMPIKKGYPWWLFNNTELYEYFPSTSPWLEAKSSGNMNKFDGSPDGIAVNTLHIFMSDVSNVECPGVLE